jgi:hypothetical protein
MCKFFQQGGNTCGGRVPWNKGLTKESDPTLQRISEKIKADRIKVKKTDETPAPGSAIPTKRKYRHHKKKLGRKPGRKPGKKAGATPVVFKNSKEAEHAFEILKKRANKGKLTDEQSRIYDNIEPSIIGLDVNEWPAGSRENIIELYKDVIKEKV